MSEVINKVLEEKEHEVLAKAEVSLILDSYNDIFSDFDPRPDSQRALSVDFLDEARRATREITPGVFELRFMIPAAHRRLDKEAIIKKRLKDHFKKHHDILAAEARKKTRKGFILSIIGFAMMVFAAFIAHLGRTEFIFTILKIVFEPGGWFTLWTGLDMLFFGSKEEKKDLEFYRKMMNADIIFMHY